jgi:hypothetical protein
MNEEARLEQALTGETEQPKPMSSFSGALKVLFAPGKVFASIREKPNWILPLIIFLVLASAATMILFPTIRTEILNNITSNPDLSEERRALIMEQASSRLTLGWILVPGLLFQAISFFAIGAVFFFVGNILLGGEGKFSQMLSVTGLAQLVAVPEHLIKVPMILAKHTMKVHTDLSLFLPVSMEDNFLFKLFSQLDLFSFWKVFLIGLGMAVLYKFTTKKSMTAAFVVWGIYIIIAAVMGKFIHLGMG